MDGRRKTRRQARESRRITHRQRGGAKWPSITESPTSGTFIATLKERGFKIETGVPPNRDTLLTYFDYQSRQDDIFDAVYSTLITYLKSKSIEFNEDDPATVIKKYKEINDEKEAFALILNNAELLINFSVDVEENKELGKTKLQELKAGVPLPLLILYPNRLKNMLMLALANIFVSLTKPENSILLDDDNARPLIAAQYEGYAQSLSYTLTAKPLSDGFFLSQGMNDFKDEVDSAFTAGDEHGAGVATRKFWTAFVYKLIMHKKPEVTVETLFRKTGDKTSRVIKKRSWGGLAADLFKFIQLKPKSTYLDLLELFEGDSGVEPTEDDKHISRYLPNLTEFGDIPLKEGLTGFTLRKILRKMDTDQLQFLLHLFHSIKTAIAKEPPTTLESGGSTA
jgi:hypothetical protein